MLFEALQFRCDPIDELRADSLTGSNPPNHVQRPSLRRGINPGAKPLTGQVTYYWDEKMGGLSKTRKFADRKRAGMEKAADREAHPQAAA